MQIPGPPLRGSNSVGLGWGLKICVTLGDCNSGGF